MPMIVDPSAPHVTPPERVTSPDGWLAAIVDDQWAGVVLSSNYRGPADTAQNLVTNPSSETNATGQLALDLAATGLVAFARVPGTAKYGGYSAKVTFGGSAPISGGAQYALSRSVIAGETVTVSLWVLLSTAPTQVAVVLRNSATGVYRSTTVATPATGGWQRVSASFVLAAGESFNRIGVNVTAASGSSFYVDGAMLETGATLHPYVDGDQAGCVWDGTPHASTSRRVTSDLPYADIRKVRITRTDPGAAAPVPVRSGDAAWAIEGVGTAYDHEAPLGVAVIYTAIALYEDGSEGPTSSVSVTVPAPEVGADDDLWIKSVDEPGLSTRCMIVEWPGATSAGRQDAVGVSGSAYRALAYDTHGAEVLPVVVDVPPELVDRMRELLRSGVLLGQVRPGYLTPDAYFVPADITGPTPTGKLGSSEGYRFGFTIEPIERPGTGGQPMRLPSWSWDELAEQFATWDAVASSYSSWASVSTNGVT